jgi:hypothetical protein
MATITIEAARVERLIPGYGFKATETTSFKGEERKVWYTVWSKEPVTEGQVLTVQGELTVKLESFTGKDNQPKQVAAIHLNNALVMTAEEIEAPF